MASKHFALQSGLTAGVILALSVAAQEHSHLANSDAKVGSVHFDTSCSPKAQPTFDRAVALDGTDKSAITPGPLAPARELLAEMLLQLNRPADALREFEATLTREPNRFRTLYGAALSAKLAGKTEVSRRHASELLKICEHSDEPGRPELVESRAMASPIGTRK